MSDGAADDLAARVARIEALLDDRLALSRESLALQREALALQREALATQKTALAESRELQAQQKANLDRAAEINRMAASVSGGARKLQMIALPAVLLLIGYVTWLLFFKLRI